MPISARLVPGGDPHFSISPLSFFCPRKRPPRFPGAASARKRLLLQPTPGAPSRARDSSYRRGIGRNRCRCTTGVAVDASAWLAPNMSLSFSCVTFSIRGGITGYRDFTDPYLRHQKSRLGSRGGFDAFFLRFSLPRRIGLLTRVFDDDKGASEGAVHGHGRTTKQTPATSR